MTLVFLFTLAIGNVWGANGDVLFSQDFNSATAVSQNLGTAAVDIDKESGNNIFGVTYTNSQFTSLKAAKISNAKGGIAINSKVESNSVEYNYEKKFGFRSDDTKASFHLVKTTNFASTAPTALKVEMNMYYKQLSSGSNITASFAIGEGFSDKEKPAKSNIHSGFTIKGNSKATFCQFGTTTDLTGYATPMTQGKDVTMTWVINHSGDVLKYTDPNGEESSLANNAFDVWVGTTKNVSGAPATTGTKALQNLYIGDCDAKRKFEFYLDEIKVTDLTPAPAATYNATFENGGHGTAPADATGVSSVTLTELTESGWINTGWKADKATKVGTTDKAAGATLNIGDKVTLLDHTTFTAQWEAEKQTPEVTFNDGAYVVGASALDLSSLFTSQNESAISFALKVASEDATVSGKNFTATKEGSYVIVATQPADATYKAVSKEATMVVTYPATGAATIIYNVAVGTSQATLATASKEDNSASISNLVGFTAVNIATRTSNGKTGSSPKLETPATKVQGKYIYVTFDVADGKEFVLDSVVTKMVAVTSSKTIEIVISDTEGTKDSLNYEQGTNNDPGAAHQFNFTSSAKAYQGTVTVKIYAYGATDDYRIGKPLKVCGTVKAATPKFAVSFAKGGADGSETMSPVNYEVGAQVTAPDCDFTYTDHIFREWAVTGVAGVTSVAAGGKFNMPNNAVTLTAQWLANNYEAKIGTTFYATLAEALLYAADGEIELLKNVDVTSQVEIAAGVTATIDLAGYKIEYTGTETLPSGVILVHNGASLTINDSSDPDAGSVVAGAKAYAAVALTKLGDDASQAANLTINGGTFTGLYYAITGNGARHNTNITINAGTFTATAENDNLAIFHPQNGTLTINGGTFTGYASAIEMRAGTLVINDGTFTATATEFSCNPSGSGSTTVGAAIAIAQHTTKEDISVTINGGTFNGVKAINEANPQGNPDPAITMSVTGGNFTGGVSTADVNNFVSGGSFSTPVAESQCATGYVPETKPNGKYGVIEPAQSIDFIAIITDKGTGDEGKAELDNQLSTKHYDIDGTLNNDRLDGGSGADKGFKVKVNGLTISFSVEAGKMVEITTGHISGANIKVDAEAAVTLATSQTYTYYSDDAQAFLITMTTGSYNIFKSINIRDPYVVTFDVNGGDAQIAPKDATPSVTLPSASKGTDSFVGWFDGETKIGKAGESYTPTANITLVAHWEAVSTDARLSAIEFSAVGTLSPAFDPDVVNYTYIMPYGTADVPTITGATAANAKAQEPVIDAQAAAWGETAHVHGVAQSGATKDYYVQMLRAPKDGICIIKSTPTSGTEADVDGIYQGSAYFKGKAANKKLNSTYDYVAVELADGYTFQAGDKVVLNQAADLGDASDITKFYVFTEVPADGKTYVTVDNAAPVKGDNWFDMPADLVGASALYIGRVDSKCNPTVGYLAVYRPLPPVLNKVTVAGVEGKPNALKQIEIEVPFSTSQSQLEAIAFDWVSNDDAWTASHTGVAANAWEFGVENTVTLTDKDGDESVYTIMVNKATASTSVELATLSIDGNAITLVPGRAVYCYEYPYGTAETPAPVVAATAADNAEVGTITQAASKNGTATFTVTAEDGTTYRDYTINISVSRIPAVVIYDGSTMTDIATKTGSDPSSRFSWSMGSNVASTGDDIAGTWQGKNYTHAVKGFKANANANNLVSFVVPEDYMAKVRLVGSTNSSGSERKMFIAKEATNDASKAIENYVITSSTYDAQGFVTDFMLPGTYYLGSTDSYRLFEFSVQLYPIDYSRDVTEGRYGTICLPNGGIMVGAELYEVAYYDGTYEKIFLDEVLNGEMVAGRPYIFLTKEGVNQIAVYYTDEENASEGNYHGLFGSYTKINLAANGHIYILKDNRYYFVDTDNVYCGANRAYFKMGVDGGISGSYVAPAPGRRRTSIGAGAPAVATGVEDVQGDNVQCTKVLINGELFIIRGEKMYDAKGQLVK